MSEKAICTISSTNDEVNEMNTILHRRLHNLKKPLKKKRQALTSKHWNPLKNEKRGQLSS